METFKGKAGEIFKSGNNKEYTPSQPLQGDKMPYGDLESLSPADLARVEQVKKTLQENPAAQQRAQEVVAALKGKEESQKGAETLAFWAVLLLSAVALHLVLRGPDDPYKGPRN